jgi:hypothetical protein
LPLLVHQETVVKMLRLLKDNYFSNNAQVEGQADVANAGGLADVANAGRLADVANAGRLAGRRATAPTR